MATKRTAARGETKAAILQLLESAPSGKSARQVALAIGKCRDQMLTRLAELAQQGKVVSVTVPSTGRAAQVWFHKAHEAEALKAGPLGWGGTKAKRARTVAQALAPKTTLRANGAKLIVADPFIDRRWTPTGPIPSVVDAAQCRPWADAAARALVSGVA